MTNPSSNFEQRKQRIVGVFNRAAHLYDQVGPHYFAYFGERLVELACIEPGRRILDVACGRGAVLFPAAQAVGLEGEVIGIDLAEAMVREANLAIQSRNLPYVTVLQMDAENLLFEPQTFDYVLSGLALLFFPQPGVALAEMWRVLKPGGHIAISTWDRQGDEIWKWFEEDLYHAHMPPRHAAEVETDPLPAQSLELDTPEGLSHAFHASGFEDISVSAETVDMIYHSKDEWWEALWATSCRLMLEEIEQAIGADGLERFKKDAFMYLETIQRADGIHQSWPLLFCLAKKPEE